jgi:hypothetical protein
MLKYIILFLAAGCSSAPTVCPTQEQEPVSLCRAEAACKPSGMKRFAAGFNNAKHGTLDKLNLNSRICEANHIEAQKSNALLKAISPDSK